MKIKLGHIALSLILISSLATNWADYGTNRTLILICQFFFIISTLKHPFDFKKTIKSPYLLAMLLLTLSNLYAELFLSSTSSWLRTIQLITHILFLLSLKEFIKTEEIEHILYSIAAWSTFFYALLMLNFFSSVESLAHYDLVSAPPGFRNIRHVSYFLCINSIILFNRLSHKHSRLTIFLLLTILSFSLWSGGRAAFISILIATFIIYTKSSNKKRLIKTIPFLAITSLVISTQIPSNNNLGFNNAINRSITMEITSGRTQIWHDTIKNISKSPIFGWGGEGFYYTTKFPPYKHAHNIILQTAIEWGLIVTTIFLIFILNTCKKIISLCHLKTLDNSTILGISLFAALLWLSFFDGVTYHNITCIFFCISIALSTQSKTVFHACNNQMVQPKMNHP